MPDLDATSAMSANAPMSLDEFAASKPQGEGYAYTYGFGGDFLNWLNGDRTRLERDYQNYLTQNNREFELQKINDARAWDEYMDSTKYQRMAKDLSAAGFNPGVVLGSGIGAVGQPSSPITSSAGSAASYERTKKKDKDRAGKALQAGTALASAAIRAIAMIAIMG